jgi:hypothetical protein
MAGSLAPTWNYYTASGLYLIGIAFDIEFIFCFLGLRPSLPVRSIQALIAAFAAIDFTGQIIGLIPLTVSQAATGPAFLIFEIILLFTLLSQSLKGNREARILFLPAVLWAFGCAIEIMNVTVFALGFRQLPLGARSLPMALPDLYIGPVPIPCIVLMDVVLDLTFPAIVFFRHVRLSRSQAQTMAELAAARAVQQVLLPGPSALVEGFAVDVEYLPAKEVGGDFYQVIPSPNGGLFILAGDVSGKGMPAALLVALLVGAFRSEIEYSTDPAKLLSTLNNRLANRMSGGFATCAALKINSDGTCILANAANPAPYLNGVEVNTEGSLPIGLLAEVEYGSTQFSISLGDTLTFVSDGVIESKRQSDGQLFGFDRVGDLLRNGINAAALAKAAQSFGQDDDITVLAIARYLPSSNIPEQRSFSRETKNPPTPPRSIAHRYFNDLTAE